MTRASAAEKFQKGLLHAAISESKKLGAQIDDLKVQLARIKGVPPPEPHKSDPNSLRLRSRNLSHQEAAVILVAIRKKNEKARAEIAAIQAAIDAIPAVHFIIANKNGTTCLERIVYAPT